MRSTGFVQFGDGRLQERGRLPMSTNLWRVSIGSRQKMTWHISGDDWVGLEAADLRGISHFYAQNCFVNQSMTLADGMVSPPS